MVGSGHEERCAGFLDVRHPEHAHAIVVGGIGGTMLSYLLRQQGVSTHTIANQFTLLLLPGSLFFLWGPLTDFFLRRRTWMLAAGAVTGVAVTLALETKNYASRTTVGLLVLAACLIYLASAALGGLVASLISENRKTQVACFMQAGNLVGGALGGGALLLLAEHAGKHTLAITAGALVFAPGRLISPGSRPSQLDGVPTLQRGLS